jgi:hypothetical protein
VEATSDHHEPKWELNGGKESSECTAGVCRAKTKQREEQGESSNEEQRMEYWRLATSEGREAAEICRDKWEYARRKEAERTGEECREKADLRHCSFVPLQALEEVLNP